MEESLPVSDGNHGTCHAARFRSSIAWGFGLLICAHLWLQSARLTSVVVAESTKRLLLEPASLTSVERALEVNGLRKLVAELRLAFVSHDRHTPEDRLSFQGTLSP